MREKELEKLNTHGGSLRYYIKKVSNNKFKIHKKVKMQLNRELRYGINKYSTYIEFKNKVESSKKKLKQIFLKLKKKNIVNSVRGTNGGYVLTKQPSEIKLAEIFLAVDEKVKTVKCNKESKKGCNGKSTKCITHNLWDDLEIHINKFFENNTLNDVLFKEVQNNSKELKQ